MLLTNKLGTLSHQAALRQVGSGLPEVASFTTMSKVVFGAPSANCSGQGICRFEDLNHRSPSPGKSGCQPGIALLHYDSGLILNLHFLIGSLSPCAQARYFCNSHFSLPEPVDYKVGPLGVLMTLQTGLYRIIHQNAFFTVPVEVRLKSNNSMARNGL
jgi:hypothetical protein